MEDAIGAMDAIEERQWSRRGAVTRAMSERRRFFTVRLDVLDEDEAEPTTDDEHPPEVQ